METKEWRRIWAAVKGTGGPGVWRWRWRWRMAICVYNPLQIYNNNSLEYHVSIIILYYSYDQQGNLTIRLMQ